jgi:HlyD family secretion protein
MIRRVPGWLRAVVLVTVIAGVGVMVWSRGRTPEIPDGIAWGNGRLEATEVRIATKRAGRIVELNVDEGDTVEANQVVARLDAEDLEAQLREAEARVHAAHSERNQAAAVVTQRSTEHALAVKDFGRTAELRRQGLISQQVFDEGQTREQMAAAALEAARALLVHAEASIPAVEAQVARVKADLADTVLMSPVNGRVLYRLAEPGEVLPPGGQVLTVVDLSDVFMTVFLPMRDAGRVPIGAEARIVLDAEPEAAIPATLSFVAPTAQFTPKEVETRNEREKLMFRAKVRVQPKAVSTRLAQVKTGLPGVAYIRIDGDGRWPERVASQDER